MSLWPYKPPVTPVRIVMTWTGDPARCCECHLSVNLFDSDKAPPRPRIVTAAYEGRTVLISADPLCRICGLAYLAKDE